ncbi:hypothetical protein [Corynebacterium antarcticum]|uniref:hypothetical protein n=1 Tax=Corynebacterium antarcticum TaxID=2800405 RepID=UPI002005DE84|nr:hypothetical protein [Corynebacterium antarcticum]MCK7659959.1 hypothetical protein [Corynebacterium antarcticum]
MEKVKTPLNAPRLLGLLLACGALTLPACQSPPHPPTDTGATPSTVDSNDSAGEHTTEVDLSSATSNADGSAIVFDPVEAGKNLPDPCVELSSEVLGRAGYLEDKERTPFGMDDDLLGKGIVCDLSLIENYDGYRSAGIYSDNIRKEFIREQGLLIRTAPESIVPNSYYYAFSPNYDNACYIGAATQRGRIGLGISGRVDWPIDSACEESRKYFDRLYLVTDGFAWLEQ